MDVLRWQTDMHPMLRESAPSLYARDGLYRVSSFNREWDAVVWIRSDLGRWRAQVALKNAKQRIAGHYLVGLQKIKDCGQRLRFCLRINCASQVLILGKFCVALLFDRFELRLQDPRSFELMHDNHHALTAGVWLTTTLAP